MRTPRAVEGDRVGDILLAEGTIGREQLADAVTRQRAGDPRPLGEILVELGHVNPADVEHALLRQRARRGEMGPGEGLQLLARAEEHTRRAGERIDELAIAATELGGKHGDGE